MNESKTDKILNSVRQAQIGIAVLKNQVKKLETQNRDLTILISTQSNGSQKILGKIFKLSPGRISQILKLTKEKYGI